METTINNNIQVKAEKYVSDIKGFYKHLMVYLIVNIFISSIKVYDDLQNGYEFQQALFQFNTFIVWFLWGIGILINWMGVFGIRLFLGSKWEERKIKEIIEKNS